MLRKQSKSLHKTQQLHKHLQRLKTRENKIYIRVHLIQDTHLQVIVGTVVVGTHWPSELFFTRKGWVDSSLFLCVAVYDDAQSVSPSKHSKTHRKSQVTLTAAHAVQSPLFLLSALTCNQPCSCLASNSLS